MEHPSQSAQRLHEVAKGQHPFAIILSCSDSRVPPEIVFDAGLGDLFVVRVAGNTAADAAIGSIEYAAEHLGAPLLVVMGHRRCGAVQAALAALNSSEPAPGHLDAFITPIIPAAKMAKQTGTDHVLDLAVQENVRRVVEQLTTSKPILAEMVHEHKLAIIGCVYDLDTGHVNIVPQSVTDTAR
jgi:carbonic anhydrase